VRRLSMKLGRIGVWVVALWVVCGLAEAALPKPVNLNDRVVTSQSQGTYGLRFTKYNKSTWGRRWKQTLSPAPIMVSPYVRGY
jgi:hypothetical protein